MRDLTFIQILGEKIITAIKSGSTSATTAGEATSALQTAGNVSLNNIDTKLVDQSTAAKQDAQKLVLDNILLELKDDTGIAETIWYNKLDTTQFFIRRSTINQDTGVVTITFHNIDGTIATPVTSNLIQVITNSDIEIVTTTYDVITSGTGYSIGDTVVENTLINTTTNTTSFIYTNKTVNNNSITPVFSHLQIKGKFTTPSHVELINATSTLAGNTYKFISFIILDGTASLTVDGITISNLPTNYVETWDAGSSIINKTISITSNLNSRVIINLMK